MDVIGRNLMSIFNRQKFIYNLRRLTNVSYNTGLLILSQIFTISDNTCTTVTSLKLY